MSKDSLISHLLELRSRLLRVILFIFVAIVIGAPFASDLFSFFASPLLASFPENSSMIATQVTSPFMAPFKLLIFSAFLISMPYFFYELWSFIAPGLFENEKSFVGPLIFSTVILFTMGVAFAYFVVCPIIFKFFIGIAPESVIVMTDITQYIGFVMKLVFAFGIAFEIPIATFLLVSSGVVKKSTLATSRPYLILLFFVIGMLLTPPDIFSQLFLAIPMWLLFEIGLLISKER
ncbi:twin-arginine translocase subunit TatC [Gammaproteobacteria bacterium]|nr:twin-arginine translocase subunit TatC [Gammaproteobacteria bacterium]MDA7786354.1 twin-arginine translocase subunit TatC [Gammaproteobacteria bacterium]MDA7856303.1 twin-arginine translocase subunit TatC [Gammaproteobacteria bacterium]MDA8856463.1 twin-arginine translocase subunit TatC [Gammaproteobacteria bacterium]MDA9010666.1 twin-arginine translocase subunit TatC [Gammaproteobacteria bacterium]|tara:strand:- start:3236 stop:3937 length:702 start_codon:yes stop_codon:yes gene_type:complete